MAEDFQKTVERYLVEEHDMSKEEAGILIAAHPSVVANGIMLNFRGVPITTMALVLKNDEKYLR